MEQNVKNSSLYFKVSNRYVYLIVLENILGLLFIVFVFCFILVQKIGGDFSSYIFIFGGILFIASMLDLLLYKRLLSIEYIIQPGRLLIKKGKFINQSTIVFTKKIFAIEKVANPLNNKLCLLTVKIHLINKDIEIRGLSVEQAELMINALESQIRNNDS